jgi:hypothetical protein
MRPSLAELLSARAIWTMSWTQQQRVPKLDNGEKYPTNWEYVDETGIFVNIFQEVKTSKEAQFCCHKHFNISSILANVAYGVSSWPQQKAGTQNWQIHIPIIFTEISLLVTYNQLSVWTYNIKLSLSTVGKPNVKEYPHWAENRTTSKWHMNLCIFKDLNKIHMGNRC